MATTPGFTQVFNEHGVLRSVYGPKLIGASNNTEGLITKDYPYGVAVAKLVAGTAPTSIQAQGSNDAFVQEVVPLCVAVTASLAAGVAFSFAPGVVPGATATNFVQQCPSGFDQVRFIIVGGDGTTSIEIDASFSTPRG